MLPTWRTLDLVPGAVPRRAHLDHISRTIARLRGGLRAERDFPLTMHAAARTGVSYDSGGGKVTMLAADTSEVHFALPLLVGDRITHWELSIERAAAEGLTVELRRFRRHVAGYEIPALHSQLSTPAAIATRQSMPAVGLRAATIETGWVYRLVVIAGNASDVVYGGSVRVDHPRSG